MPFIRELAIIITLIVLTPTLGALVIVSALIGVRDHPGSVYAWVPRVWSRAILVASGVKVVEHNLEHKGGSRHIFVANHLGNYDVLTLAAYLPWIKFVAKAELFKVPLFGRIIRAAGMVPIDRANRKAAFSAYSVATQKIQSGASVAVYPEGTRGYSYPIRPFKKGPFVLAVQAQAPIVPVLVYGALDIQKRHSLRIHGGTIHLHYLEPIVTEGLTYEDRTAIARRTYEAMARCLQENYGVESPPFSAS